MAEEAKKEETVAKKPKGPIYYVENTVRRVGTRLHRAKSPTRHRFKLFIAGQRLLRNRKMPLNEEQFEANQEKIREGLAINKRGSKSGRLIRTKPNGAVKIDDDPQPTQAPPKASKEPEETPQPPAEEPVEVEVPPEELAAAEPDDLTELPGIGGGRAKKLAEAGVTTFAGVVELGAQGLMDLLGLNEEAAAEIIAAAQE